MSGEVDITGGCGKGREVPFNGESGKRMCFWKETVLRSAGSHVGFGVLWWFCDSFGVV